MKHFLTLITALMTVITAMAQSPGIVLSYNKGQELKFFKSNQLADAIDAAEVNDTLYFGSGTYNINNLPDYNSDYNTKRCQINKPLTFIGIGCDNNDGTVFYSSTGAYSMTCFLNIADSGIEKTKRNFGFEGICFDCFTIHLATDLNKLELVNCSVEVNDRNDYNDTYCAIDTVRIDRCSGRSLLFPGRRIKCMEINNSRYFGQQSNKWDWSKPSISGGCDSNFEMASISHCYLGYIPTGFEGKVQYSLIKSCDSKTVSLEDCIVDSNAENLDDDPTSLGDCKDRTAYGTSGGSTPYTPYSQYPNPDTSIDVTTNKPKSYVDYDALNKRLTVTVKLMGK